MQHTDANEVIEIGIFDQQVSPLLLSYFSFHSCLASNTGISLRLPSFLFSSSPHLCLHQAGLFTSRANPIALNFEALPVFIPWRDKMAYNFIVNGRWTTNNVEPTEVDPGFIIDVYTTPPIPVLP